MTMDLIELNEHFGLPGVLTFRATSGGLFYADITTPHASATIFLQGAHVTAWQPAGHSPVLFTSHMTEPVAGKAIRGGVPICFPWFGDRHDGKTGPSHGFARIQEWTVAFAALAGDDLHITFTLGPTDLSRSLGFDQFRVAYQLIIGSSLTMQLTVANDAQAPLVFEEALHTYYAVGDITQANLTGLEDVSYLDKEDGLKEKIQRGAVAITGPTDRVYLDTATTCLLHDTINNRRIVVAKINSNVTVVWNPWESGAAKLHDMRAEEWKQFLAVEAANAARDFITLAPGAAHTMQAHVTVEGTET